MKCLLRYQWVKLPRNQLPPGKGIMGAWARLEHKPQSIKKSLSGGLFGRLAGGSDAAGGDLSAKQARDHVPRLLSSQDCIQLQL